MKKPAAILIVIVIAAAALVAYRALQHEDHNEHNGTVDDHSAMLDAYNQHAEHAGPDDHEDHSDCQGHEDHPEPEAHADHDDCESGEGHAGPVIELSGEQIKTIGLKTKFAASGTIDITIPLAGEINLNQDRMAHVVPRVKGVVTEVRKKLGDTVAAGETIAVIVSQELADAKANYLASVERHEMAAYSFEREEKLWKEKVSSEQDYLDMKQALTEASIQKRAAEQKLLAIGFDKKTLTELSGASEQTLTHFEITAPFNGTIIEKHIVLGELVSGESTVFVIADLKTVWADLHVYPSDLSRVKEGQTILIAAGPEIPNASGVISYVGPVVGAESRTALARVVLPNTSGLFRPGLFITAQVSVSAAKSKIVVVKDAIQSLQERKCVFIKDDHGYEPVFVEIGRQSQTHVEILSGLSAGQEYVSKGAFALKSKIVTSTLDSHAGHGH